MAGQQKSRSSQTRAASEDEATITLAHPISPPYHTGLGLEPKDEDYRVGDDVTVSKSVAQAIIAAGYAQVDPEDPQAVAKALGVDDGTAQQVVDNLTGGGESTAPVA